MNKDRLGVMQKYLPNLYDLKTGPALENPIFSCTAYEPKLEAVKSQKSSQPSLKEIINI